MIEKILDNFSFRRVLDWASSRSIQYLTIGNYCCADEVGHLSQCRYDVERLGFTPTRLPAEADLLIIQGGLSSKALWEAREIYQTMDHPKYVMAVGTCACAGGLFSHEKNYARVSTEDWGFKVDIYVPGCPPRPEAIMKGLITLQEKIRGMPVYYE